MDLREYAKNSIHAGSKSFTFAGYLFRPETRDDAFALYSWCRYCDDQIDECHSEKESLERLNELKINTEKALQGEGDLLPLPYRALSVVVKKHNIPAHYPIELLNGMEMDVSKHNYLSSYDLELYCYRVAGVVGLMMAHIMGVNNEKALQSACDLGKAMQLTNISRDIADDLKLDRLYIPQSWLSDRGLTKANLMDSRSRKNLVEVTHRLLDWADEFYTSGNSGISHLNWRCAFAIQAASNIYREIGIKVRSKKDFAWENRQYTKKFEKLFLVGKSFFQMLAKTYWQISRPWFPTKNLKVIPSK